jgi:hypothetical protein
MVKDITWVDGTGAVHVSKRHSDVGHGLCSGLGLMGVMTELTVQLEVGEESYVMPPPPST